MPGNVVALSVLVPWKDRDELEHTLELNRAAFEAAGAEALVLNCGGDRAALVRMKQRLGIPYLRLVETTQDTFNKSLGFNIGTRFARADRLFMMDSDVLLPPDLLVEMLRRLQDGVFVTVEWMQESASPPMQREKPWTETIRTNVMEFRFPDGTTRSVLTHRYSVTTQRRSGLSLLLLEKSSFLAVDGFHSGIGSWGWEDNDFHLRLQWRLGLKVVEHGTVLHLTHDDARRALGGKTQMESLNANLLAAVARYEQGDLQGTCEADQAQWGEAAYEVM